MFKFKLFILNFIIFLNSKLWGFGVLGRSEERRVGKE
jgi:hypothetical protein